MAQGSTRTAVRDHVLTGGAACQDVAMIETSGARTGRLLRYGVDAPYVPLTLGILGVVGVVVGLVVSSLGWAIVVGAIFLIQAAIYLHATLRGKHRAWAKLLDDLQLGGDEQILDVGCGRGAVLLAAARRLPRGRAHGVDLWRSVDQSGNSREVTASNAAAEGVAERVELHTGDMTDLPFPDGRFDVVASSLAIHNLPTLAARFRAIDEAMRVLRPGGHLVVADIRTVGKYAEHLRAVNAADVKSRNLGPTFWFSGPWQATSVVTATKP
jgi:arsenite methyltransferase